MEKLINKIRSTKFRILLTILGVLIAPAIAFAVVQSLNNQTGQTQLFANDTNVTINSANDVHALGWIGQLPVSRGGTGNDAFIEGSVIFMGQNKFRQDNNNFFWDRINNWLGIGTNLPIGALTIQNTASNSPSIWSGPSLTDFDSQVQTRWSGGTGVNVFSSIDRLGGQTGWFLSQESADDANALTGISYATTGQARAFGGNFFAHSIAPAGQTVGLVAGLFIRSVNEGDGTVAEMMGINVDSNGANGVVENNYGILVNPQSAGTNNYAIWTSQGSGENNYALYNSGNAKSYFGGNVGIGTTNPTANLDVAGTIRGGSTLFLGSSTAPGCIAMGDSDGDGITYVTVNDGVLTTSVTKPDACQ